MQGPALVLLLGWEWKEHHCQHLSIEQVRCQVLKTTDQLLACGLTGDSRCHG